MYVCSLKKTSFQWILYPWTVRFLDTRCDLGATAPEGAKQHAQAALPDLLVIVALVTGAVRIVRVVAEVPGSVGAVLR